ncbi:MAG: TolB family protein, partial [Candidatus Aminicenantales bacterium]
MNHSIFKQKISLLWILVLLFPLLILPQVHSFPLEAVMNYAFPSNLVVSPHGDLVAWVFNWQGKRNIWVAKGPQYKAYQQTSYALDDGQELGHLAFNFDGTIIVYVRGGSTNKAGEYPNPTSNPRGAEQAVWAVRIAGGRPWRIGRGSNPVPSPTANQVAYTLRGKIYLASLDRKSKPKLLFQARGRNSQQAWSPDGTKLAFTSYREDHSFIGIYDLQKKSIRWLSPSVDRDLYPVWSPDGKYIAFIRFPGLASVSFRGGEKYSLMVADVASGQAKLLWQCPNATGGFAQYYPAHTLRWAADNHLVFYSEHEGWMHLYSISLKNGKLISLTPGDFEVEDSFLTPDGKTIIFNSNKDDIDRRHLWSVSVSGGQAQLITSGKGLEWAPVLTSKSKDLIFLCSTAFQPAAPAIMKN